MSVDSQKMWLVKSAGRILGPYSLDEIEQSLITREFVLLDEAARPFRRFRSFREWTEFKEITERLRQRQRLSGDDLTSTASVMSSTASLTVPLPPHFHDNLTDEIASAPKEVVVVDLEEEVVENKRAAPSKSRYQTKDQADQSLEKSGKKWGRWLSVMSVVVVSLSIFFFFGDRLNRLNVSQQADPSSLTDAGYLAIERGDLIEALRLFKQAESLRPYDPVVVSALAPLLVQLEGQTALARRLIEGAFSKEGSLTASLLSTIGLSFLKDGDFSPAQSYFDQALQAEAQFVPALHNNGVLHLRAKRWVKAKNFFSTAIDLEPENEVPILYLALTGLKQLRRLKPKDTAQIREKLSNFLSNQAFGYHAVSLLLASFLTFENKQNEAVEVLSRAMSQDPYLDLELTQNVFFEAEEIKWSQLLNLCLEITEKLGQQSLVQGFKSFCYAKANDQISAVSSIEAALNQSPRAPHLLIMASFIYDLAGQNDQKTAMLNRAFNENGSQIENHLSLVIQARHLEKSRDFEGANLLWRKILITEPDSLPALTGRARNALERRDFINFEEIKNEISRFTDRYIPLRILDVEAKQLREEKS